MPLFYAEGNLFQKMNYSGGSFEALQTKKLDIYIFLLYYTDEFDNISDQLNVRFYQFSNNLITF